MKPVFRMALVLACLAVGPWLRAQTSSNGSGANSGSGQNQPAASSQNPAPAQSPSRVPSQSNSNPFPEDESNVPVIPTGNAPVLPPGDEAGSRIPLPAADVDPVRSPEDAAQTAEEQQQTSSSSLAGMGNLLPGPDDDTQSGKRHGKGEQIVPDHHETAAEDENVGKYYLDNKDWKAALSRYESALVLDPDNPDVYWGLAESQRHLGDFASARANYLKVMEYDPGSHHANEARKALKEPEIANAKASNSTPPATPAPQ